MSKLIDVIIVVCCVFGVTGHTLSWIPVAVFSAWRFSEPE